MCSISGIMIGKNCNDVEKALHVLSEVIVRAEDRGRDSWGYYAKLRDGSGRYERFVSSPSKTGIKFPENISWIINNNRAEPTTEYIRDKTLNDVQPFVNHNWIVAHNGTIANDKAIYTKYGMNPVDTRIDSAVIPALLNDRFADIFDPSEVVNLLVRELIGSYALAVGNNRYPDDLLLLVNYKPLYLAYSSSNDYLIFTSLESYMSDHANLDEKLKSDLNVVQIPPYSYVHIKSTSNGIVVKNTSIKPENNRKALVVCSGGLDSTVVATKAIRDGYDVTLLHFLYGCRAEEKEKVSIIAIAERLGCQYLFVSTSVFTETIGGSPLTNTATTVFSDGVAGAEFAHEWVPARNLIMLSVATGIAESKGYDTIMLGNNLEESGAYADNEMQFVLRFADILPYATQVNRHISIQMPVGNLMKHEIVKLGLEIGAPLDLTWSCYDNGSLHCGICGPCFMRKTAFQINHKPEVIKYLQ